MKTRLKRLSLVRLTKSWIGFDNQHCSANQTGAALFQFRYTFVRLVQYNLILSVLYNMRCFKTGRFYKLPARPSALLHQENFITNIPLYFERTQVYIVSKTRHAAGNGLEDVAGGATVAISPTEKSTPSVAGRRNGSTLPSAIEYGR
jgi:hypothetical protein